MLDIDNRTILIVLLLQFSQHLTPKISMRQLLALTIGFLVMASVISLHPGNTQNCQSMSSYMVNAAGQCVDLGGRQAVANPSAKLQRASAILATPKQLSAFPPQQTVNTIVVDNNNDFLAAIRKLKAGDRLLVKNGTYRTRVVSAKITVTAEGTADNWVVIAAYPGEKPQIKGTDWAAINLNNAKYVEIRGFDIEGAYPSQNPSGSGITVSDRSHNIRLIDNIIHDVPGGAIEVQHSDYLYLEGNTIYNTAWGWLPTNPEQSNANSAISFYQLTDSDQSEAGIRNIVRNNVVLNTYNTKPFVNDTRITDGNCFILDDTQHTQSTGSAVQAGFVDPYTGTTLFENNLCVDNGGRGVHAFFSDNLLVRNNTLYRNAKTPGIIGELSSVRSNNIGFYNNIIYANAGSTAIVNDNSNGVDIDDNLVFGSDRMDGTIGRLIKADPLFFNPSIDLKTADFSLRSGSPAIGAGSTENCAATYFDGTPRSGACTVGAFPVAR
jgi:Right handed beta helix region